MSEKVLFIYTASIDEGILHWQAFRAENEEQIAQYLLSRAWKQPHLLRDLRLDVRDLDRLTPADVLRQIQNSYVDGDSRIGFRLFRVEPKDVIELPEKSAPPASSSPASPSPRPGA
jgi:hypothetical protein